MNKIEDCILAMSNNQGRRSIKFLTTYIELIDHSSARKRASLLHVFRKSKAYRFIILRFNNLKLQMKFFLILAFTLIFAFIGMLATSHMTDKSHNDALYERTVQLLTIFSENIQRDLDSIAYTSFNIIADNVLQESISRMTRSPVGSGEWMKAHQAVEKRIMNISLVNSVIQSIRLMAYDDVKSEFNRVNAGVPIQASSMRDHVDAAHKARGREVWLPDTVASGKILLLREIREVANLSLEPIGLLAMKINMEQVVDNCSQALSEVNMPLLCSISINDLCVYTNQRELSMIDLEDDPFRILNLDGKTLFCVKYSPIDYSWTYVAALPYDGVSDSIHFANSARLAIAISTFLIALLLGTLLTASIIKHFKRLQQKYDDFAHGIMSTTEESGIYNERRDEIGELHRGFDCMAREHQAMIQDSYVKQQLLLETQLKQLRGQIQPHFLYNTLESIYCLAEIDGNDRIATMTSALGKLLRATINEKRDVITIDEDMRIAKEYICIQQIRLGNQLQVDFRISQEFFNVPIPSMTLQPLLENAIKHGAEEMLDVCHISVYCLREKQYVDLIIEDNGPGMDTDMIQKLDNGDIKPEGLGIGMLNIHKRLLLIFKDEECGLSVRRENGLTMVIVRVSFGGGRND